MHIKYRKDATLEPDIYTWHAKLREYDQPTAKRRYIDITRIAKRVSENTFPGYLYSADKIEAKEVFLLVSETVLIFDPKTEDVLQSVPVETIETCVRILSTSNRCCHSLDVHKLESNERI